MTSKPSPARSDAAGGSRSRVTANRILLLVALFAVVLGAYLGQTFITWLNATLL